MVSFLYETAHNNDSIMVPGFSRLRQMGTIKINGAKRKRVINAKFLQQQAGGGGRGGG